MATPRMLLRFLDHSGPDWIQMNVANQFQKINVCIHQDRLVTSLKKMARPPPAPVDPPRITKAEILKDSGKGSLLDSNREVSRIAHQAERMDAMAEPFDSFLQQEEKARPVPIVKENALSVVAPQDDVIQCPGIMNPRFACHAAMLSRVSQHSKAWPDRDRMLVLSLVKDIEII
jgi:hypothetical protein